MEFAPLAGIKADAANGVDGNEILDYSFFWEVGTGDDGGVFGCAMVSEGMGIRWRSMFYDNIMNTSQKFQPTRRQAWLAAGGINMACDESLGTQLQRLLGLSNTMYGGGDVQALAHL